MVIFIWASGGIIHWRMFENYTLKSQQHLTGVNELKYFITDMTLWYRWKVIHSQNVSLTYDVMTWTHPAMFTIAGGQLWDHSFSWWCHQWKYFPRYWSFVRRIHRSPVNSHQKGQWRGALMFSLICVWINGWVNNRDAGDFRMCRKFEYKCSCKIR